MNRFKIKTFAIGITLVVAFIITIAVLSFRQSRKVDIVSSRIEYTRSILLQLNNLYSIIIEHAGAARNYSLNGEQDIQKMRTTASDLLSKLEHLKTLVKERPGQHIQFDSLAKYITKRIEFSDQLITKGKEQGLKAAAELYNTGMGREYNNFVLLYIQKMQADELNTLQQDEEKNINSIKQLNNYLAGLLIIILILVIILVQKSRLDIALRKKTEDHLKSFNLQLQNQVKEKAAELTGVFERITDGFIALDKNFCFTYVNKRAGQMTGRDPDSFIGKNIWKEFDKSISPQFRDAILKAMKDQEYICFEEYSPAYDCWFEDHLYPSPEGLSIFYRDVSERKKTAEEKERVRYQLNERVKELTTLYSAGQILQAEEKSVEAVLQEIVSILPGGWQFPEICAAKIVLGKSVFTTPNFADSSYKQNATFEFADLTGMIEIVYLEERPAETEGPFVAEERNLINMLAEMLRIYFVRKRAVELIVREKNLSDSVINSLPGVFYCYDRSGKFIRWNKRFKTVTGYSDEEISKMHPLDFFEGEDKKIIQICIDDVFEKGGSIAEAFFFSKDKTKIPYYFTGTSIEIESVPFSLGIGTDITERKKAEEELRISRENLEKSYKEIRLLASNIENIREQEKIKIAREIHDELGQQLTGLKMDVSWLGKKLNPEQTILQQKTKEILLLLDEAVRSVRRIASELRPGLLDDLGLVAAIEWQSEEFEKRSGIRTLFKSTVNDEIIPVRLATGFFRIYQESLTNVARHAQAHEIIAILEQKNEEIILQITDDGIGFDAKEITNKKTLGLLGMKERTMMMGGRYEIISKPGEGTTVVVAVPLSENNVRKN